MTPPPDGTWPDKLAAELLRAFVPDEQLMTEGMRETPKRMVSALQELLGGYGVDLADVLGTDFEGEGYDQVVIVRGIPFSSLCEHHVLPFMGTVDVAYLPSDRIVGLSKIPRLVRAVSRRLQVQERMTQQIAGALEEHLAPKGVVVVARGTHTCMTMRGIESDGQMVTSDVRGIFRDDAPARAEVLGLFR